MSTERLASVSKQALRSVLGCFQETSVLKVKIWLINFERKGKIMTVFGIIFAMVVAACAEYGARTNMKDFA